MFCSEVELGNHFLATILDVLIPCEFDAIFDQTSLNYNIYTGPSGIQVLDFQCSRDYITKFLDREFDLVSSENHKVVNFISTHENPTFLINKAAIEFFEHLHKDLEELKNKVKDKKLVVTGQSLGGYIAILFTLWLHYAYDNKMKYDSKKTTRPICITFGSPLIGDKALESAISERPKWKSSFLSVVSITDPFACFYSSDTSYKPFSTFLFCTPSGGHTTFEDNEAILAVLDKMASSRSRSNPCNSRRMHEYINELSLVRSKVLHCGVICEFSDELNSNSLKAGIALQFRDIGMCTSNDLINKLAERKSEKMRKSVGIYSDEKKLNKRKIDMAFMEWFISSMRSRSGYYDCYKSDPKREENSFHNQITESHGKLNQYWDEFVKAKELMPQKEGVNLRKRWLYSGNNYRRMFEPLDIAKYYKSGKRKYIDNRPNRYKLLEHWWNEDKKDLNPNERKEGPNVNDDSCFWAHVEEALISLRILTNGISSTEIDEIEQKYNFRGYVMRFRAHVEEALISLRILTRASSSINVNEIEQKLDTFITYVMQSIINNSLSSDIFLEGSSLMKWWKEYDAYKTGLCNSEFAEYMKSGEYKSYQ